MVLRIREQLGVVGEQLGGGWGAVREHIKFESVSYKVVAK